MTEKTEQKVSVSAPFVFPFQSGRPAGQEIRLKEVALVLFKRRAWIMICIIFGIVFGLMLSAFTYIKSQALRQYTVKTSIALTSQSSGGLFSRQSRDPDSTDYYLAEDMVDAASYVLRSDTMLDEVIEELNLIGVSARDIDGSLSITQYEKTQILQLTLYWGNATEGIKILETMNRLAPQMLLKILKLGNVTVINEPTARFVIGANLHLMRNLILGIMLGLMAGAALSILDLMLRPTLMSLTDVEDKLRVPLLGTVPVNNSNNRIQIELLGREKNVLERSDLADHFLSMAYSVKYRLEEYDHPCLIVTSAERGEGRTFATACLAAALAQIGMRTLAVDLDFQNPMLGGMFIRRIDPVKTVNALYRGETLQMDAIQPVSGKLDLLPALLEKDPIPLNTAVGELIQRLRSDYDVVLLDTPPVGEVADTMVLYELTDQAVFVIQYDGTTFNALRNALERLQKVNIGVLGTVVNRMRVKIGDYHDRQSLGVGKKKKRKKKKAAKKGMKNSGKRSPDKKAPRGETASQK